MTMGMSYYLKETAPAAEGDAAAAEAAAEAEAAAAEATWPGWILWPRPQWWTHIEPATPRLRFVPVELPLPIRYGLLMLVPRI